MKVPKTDLATDCTRPTFFAEVEIFTLSFSTSAPPFGLINIIISWFPVQDKLECLSIYGPESSLKYIFLTETSVA